MAASPTKAPNSDMATKDAMFLFDLFRESPTPILIQIGPYAAKTGAKPNTIIKRLAGIKARNGLNISTTLGNYKPSAGADGGNAEVRPKVKSVKNRQHVFSANGKEPAVKKEGNRMAFIEDRGFVRAGPMSNALPTPVASPSTSTDVSHHWYPETHPQDSPQNSSAVVSDSLHSGIVKRTYQQTADDGVEESDLEGTPWKRFKVE